MINKNDGESDGFSCADYVNVEEHKQTCYADIEGNLR